MAKYATSTESLNRLDELATKLTALMAATFGESGESFRDLNGEIQDAYLWTCSDMAQEMRQLLGRMEICHD
ncbi:MAG: hypothetical protein EOO27_01005 [Comamonadaceae bacterium]|nr:MAG: hypothetical protein EOO27_01005 [Comamonadaceae bacterium]